MDLDVKLQGFYSTVNRFLETYDEDIGHCNKLVEQIQEHKKQIRSCENVDVDDFKIEWDQKWHPSIAERSTGIMTSFFKKLSNFLN